MVLDVVYLLGEQIWAIHPRCGASWCASPKRCTYRETPRAIHFELGVRWEISQQGRYSCVCCNLHMQATFASKSFHWVVQWRVYGTAMHTWRSCRRRHYIFIYHRRGQCATPKLLGILGFHRDGKQWAINERARVAKCKYTLAQPRERALLLIEVNFESTRIWHYTVEIY